MYLIIAIILAYSFTWKFFIDLKIRKTIDETHRYQQKISESKIHRSLWLHMLSYFSIDLFFIFFVEKGKYYIDFKNGSGQVGEGDPASKADVTITMNEEIFLKIFNRKLTFIIRSK